MEKALMSHLLYIVLVTKKDEFRLEQVQRKSPRKSGEQRVSHTRRDYRSLACLV